MQEEDLYCLLQISDIVGVDESSAPSSSEESIRRGEEKGGGGEYPEWVVRLRAGTVIPLISIIDSLQVVFESSLIFSRMGLIPSSNVSCTMLYRGR